MVCTLFWWNFVKGCNYNCWIISYCCLQKERKEEANEIKWKRRKYTE